jgi:hypothetical protein
MRDSRVGVISRGSATLGTASAAPSAKDLGNPKRSARGRRLTTFSCMLQPSIVVLRGADMVATRRHLATTHRSRSVAAVLLAFRLIRSSPSTAFPPNIALPLAAKGWKHAVRGARAGVLSFMFASASCAPTAWSGDGAVKGHRVPAGYPAPRCDDPVVFAQIGAEYRGRHWASGFAAVGIRAHEASWESWPQYMPRRFCEGTIKSLSGAERPIYYAIIADGPGYELEWCVVGLDRGWPYDRRCRLARP